MGANQWTIEAKKLENNDKGDDSTEEIANMNQAARSANLHLVLGQAEVKWNEYLFCQELRRVYYKEFIRATTEESQKEHRERLQKQQCKFEVDKVETLDGRGNLNIRKRMEEESWARCFSIYPKTCSSVAERGDTQLEKLDLDTYTLKNLNDDDPNDDD